MTGPVADIASPANLTQMYGPAVRCKRDIRMAVSVLHQCIRPLGHGFRAHPMSLADRPLWAKWVTRFRLCPGRPFLHPSIHSRRPRRDSTCGNCPSRKRRLRHRMPASSSTRCSSVGPWGACSATSAPKQGRVPERVRQLDRVRADELNGTVKVGA
jgi:hypothetical protein